MNFAGTKKEKFFFHNTLLCLVNAMEHKYVTIDLRNDTYVCGFMESVDGYMNITLTDAVYCDARGNEYKLEKFFLHSRNIRYVHIPESMPLLETIEYELSKGHPRKREDDDDDDDYRKKVQKFNRKKQKALAQHLKIVASLPSK